MPEENARFLFTFSAEATEELMAGRASLSAGGLRRPDGTMFELAKPVLIDPADIATRPNQTEDEYIKSQLYGVNEKLDQMLSDTQALNQIEWMNYAVNCQTYEMTYQGFQAVIERLDAISLQLSNFQNHLDNRDFNDMLELNNKYRNNLKTIAGAMETPKFSVALTALSIEPMINEIQAYFVRICSEMKSRSKPDQLVLSSIISLLKPYCYVVRKYSALYFYENGIYPPNYALWTNVINDIIKDPRFRKRIQYFLRVNSELNFEDIFIARDKAVFNLIVETEKLDFDHRYALCHSKEQYLSIDEQLQNKIAANKFEVVDGHLLVELD